MKEYLQDYDGLPFVGTVEGQLVRDQDGLAVYFSDNNTALRWAMLNLPTGRIRVCPGEYEVGRLGAPAKGHHLIGDCTTIIAPGDDAVYFDKQPERPVLFELFDIEAGRRSAITTHDDGARETGYRIDFDGCTIDGGFDHAANAGRDSKWGFNLHRHAGFIRRTTIKDIKREHGDYRHSMAGNCYIDDCLFSRCGRSGTQHVGREHESGWSNYEIRITDTTFEDCGLSDGGAAITMQGMRRGVVRRVRSTIGRDDDFVKRYMASHPEKTRFGSTHLVNWSEVTPHTPNVNLPSEGIWLDSYTAWTRQGCGNGPAVEVKNAKTLALTGNIKIQMGSEFHPAIVVEGAALQFDGLETLTLKRGEKGEP